MTKAILCDRVGCKNVLRDTDLHIVTAKWHRAEQAGIDGRLHPSSKAKRESHYCSLECAATWADDELARIAEWESKEAVRREQLRAEDMDALDDELGEDDEDSEIDVPHPELVAEQLAAGDA